jgi:hypothetical protein
MNPNAATALPVPPRPDLQQYRKLAKELVRSCRSGERAAIRVWAQNWIARLIAALPETPAPEERHAMEALLDDLEAFAASRLTGVEGPGKTCLLSEAQFVIARAHGFKSWRRFSSHIGELNGSGSGVARFEAAADAIVAGDSATLKRLLEEDPGLARARSTREHGATLLHYIGANGYESYRQKSPPNAVAIAMLLLDAGADVNAADAMGKGTALGLVATSVHTQRAGVQTALLEALLARGAFVEGASDGWNPLLAALKNDQPRSAELLVARGAQMDLQSAAGMGRLDVIQRYFDLAGVPEREATRDTLQAALALACKQGRDQVIEFLLDRGADLRAGERTGQTALHWAVIGGQLSTIELLLARGAPLEAVNCHGGTVLDQAMWCVSNCDDSVAYVPIIERLVAAGAKVDLYPGFEEKVAAVLRRGRPEE